LRTRATTCTLLPSIALEEPPPPIPLMLERWENDSWDDELQITPEKTRQLLLLLLLLLLLRRRRPWSCGCRLSKSFFSLFETEKALVIYYWYSVVFRREKFLPFTFLTRHARIIPQTVKN
jgi:hypothetical protein